MAERICINVKDVMRITGRGVRYSRNLLHEIAEDLNKPKTALITIREFCNYTKIDIQEVKPLIKG